MISFFFSKTILHRQKIHKCLQIRERIIYYNKEIKNGGGVNNGNNRITSSSSNF